MPLAEIRERFTTSEQVILSWKNQEVMYKMRSQGKGKRGSRGTAGEKSSDKPRHEYGDPTIDNLPDRFFNEEGELDLSGVRGEEAVTVMNQQLTALGMKPMPRYGR